MVIGLVFSAQAQENISENTIGVRFGNHYGLEVEITYQRMLSPKNRLELNTGWSSSNHTEAFKLFGIYQWYWNIEKGLYWYTGGGGGFGTWNTDNDYDNPYANDNGFFMVATGDIGVEYHIKGVPIQLSLDGRPEYVFNSFEKDNFGFNAGVAIRYKF